MARSLQQLEAGASGHALIPRIHGRRNEEIMMRKSTKLFRKKILGWGFLLVVSMWSCATSSSPEIDLEDPVALQERLDQVSVDLELRKEGHTEEWNLSPFHLPQGYTLTELHQTIQQIDNAQDKKAARSVLEGLRLDLGCRPFQFSYALIDKVKEDLWQLLLGDLCDLDSSALLREIAYVRSLESNLYVAQHYLDTNDARAESYVKKLEQVARLKPVSVDERQIEIEAKFDQFYRKAAELYFTHDLEKPLGESSRPHYRPHEMEPSHQRRGPLRVGSSDG